MENARIVSLIVVVLLAACAGSQQPADEPWRVEMTSSGGIAGKGMGSLAIDSAGAFTVTTMSGKTCPDKLSDDESQRLAKAVANAKPETWQKPGAESICCDRIEWSLALTVGGKTHTVTWIDDPKFAMTDDLRALTNVLADIRASHMAKCR